MQEELEKPELHPSPIWRCRDKECKAWFREEMAESKDPECPLCKGRMLRGMKHLPKLSKKLKPARKEKKRLH